MKAAIKSHIGKRETNQDYVSTFINSSNQVLAVLCDGMGGHNAGDIASEMAVLQLGNSWKKSSFEEQDSHSAEKWLRDHINKENKRIYDAANVFRDLQGMGTTMVAAAIFKDTTIVANVGDSRAYSFDNHSLKKITEDHSFANELKINGQITEEEARTHEKRNMLTRSLGVETKVAIDFFYLSNLNKQYLMLCSDGLSNSLTEEEMATVLVKPDSSDTNKAVQLVDDAIKHGASDNVTVCLINLASASNLKSAAVQEGGTSNGNW